MNTLKRLAASLNGLSGIKKVLFLIIDAFLFALPFMTKNIVLYLPDGFNFSFFGWIGLSALFLTVFDFKKTLKRVFGSLFCFFAVFYFFVYSWFVNLYPLDFAGLGNAESVLVILCAVVLIPIIHGMLMTVCVFIGYVGANKIESKYLKAVVIGFAYVLGEYVQSLGIFALPWARLFVGQTENVYVLQSASLFGSYFVTFLMVVVNALFAFSLVNLNCGIKKSRNYALAAVILFAVNFLFGFLRVTLACDDGYKTLNAMVLQGNIPSSEKWSETISSSEVYLNLAYEAANEGFDADIAVMPETAIPVTVYPNDGYVSETEKVLHTISKILDAELFAGAFNKENGNSYNSIFVFSPDESVSKPYNKHNIVPFGEFLPYRNIIEKIAPSFAEMNMFTSDISRGTDFEPIPTKAGMAACLVCFDSIFPETARKQIKNGGEFIVVSTNDSWYKTSSGIYQHADHSVMRAIENNVPVIRSANTGISRIIDNYGNVVASSSVNEREIICETVSLPETGTLYTVTGDLIVPVSAISILFLFICGFFRKKQPFTKMKD